MKLEEIQKLIEASTPGPWKYDWGNWEVEGPRPDRYAICGMTPDDRAPGFHGQKPNPVDSPADGEFIAASRTLLPKLLKVARAAKAVVIKDAAEFDGVTNPAMSALYDAVAKLEEAE